MATIVGTGNTAPVLTTVTVLLYSWTFFSYITRMLVKIGQRNAWNSEDTTISLSVLMGFANIVATCYAVNHGYGNPWPSLSEVDKYQIHKALYASQVFYVISIGFTKTSASFFTGRVFAAPTSPVARVVKLCTRTCETWTIATILVVSCRGRMSEPWSTLEGSKTMFIRWLIVEVTGYIIDLGSVAIAVCLVWRTQMSKQKRLLVCGMFTSRLLTTPLVILRLWNLSPSNTFSPSSPRVTGDIFTEAVMNCALILTSVTCWKPLLHPFRPGRSERTNAYPKSASTHSTVFKCPRPDPYYELEEIPFNTKGTEELEEIAPRRYSTRGGTFYGAGGNGDERGHITSNFKPPLSLGFDRCEHKVTVEPTPSTMSPLNSTRILSTRDWTVRYDDLH